MVSLKASLAWSTLVLTVMLSTAVLANGVARADEPVQVKVARNEEEAWFYRFRRATDLAGDPEDPSGTGHLNFVKRNAETPSPYDDGTLRIGLLNGQPEARTFFALPSLFELGADAEIVGGKVTFQLHADDDSLREPQSADMVACLAKEAVVSEEAANWSNQPTFDCKVKAPLELDKGSDPPTWTLGLAVFAAAWRAGSPRHGLAILENPQPSEGNASWHVGFRSVNHPDGPGITSELQVRVADPAVAATIARGGVITGGVPDGSSFTAFSPGNVAAGVASDRLESRGPDPSVGVEPTNAIPLGRGRELLTAIIVALLCGGALFHIINQANRLETADALEPEGTVVES